MSENSVIRHYKKQLIHRQSDPSPTTPEVENSIYDFEVNTGNGNTLRKSLRQKRKNKNCRSQFRHEDLEFFKLGSNSSNSLCKTGKEIASSKPCENPPILEAPPRKTIIPTIGHTLPQIVPPRHDYPTHPITYPLPAIPLLPPLPPPPSYPFHLLQPYKVPPFQSQPQKRKLPEKEGPVIDLTVDDIKPHKCQCTCGRSYPSKDEPPLAEDVLVTVTAERKSEQVPITFRGKMVNGVLQLNNTNSVPNSIKILPPEDTKKEDVTSPESDKLPPLFLIKDLMAQGVKLENKVKKAVVPTTVVKEATVPTPAAKKTVVPTAPVANQAEVPTPVAKKTVAPTTHVAKKTVVPTTPIAKKTVAPTTHVTKKTVETTTHVAKKTVETTTPVAKKTVVPTPVIVNPPQKGTTNNRRQSIDTISVSSTNSNDINKQIPQGKLFYIKSKNSLIRYFEDTQKKLFLDNVKNDGSNYENDNNEIIELPSNVIFSTKDSLTVEEYVTEMNFVEKFIPRDFFAFYRFVTGYQIYNNHCPVSFLTFLKVYNTNGLKILLDRYVDSLKQTN